MVATTVVRISQSCPCRTPPIVLKNLASLSRLPGEISIVSALSIFVWSVADTLRGPYSESEYGSVILLFTLQRRLARVVDPHREVMAGVASGYQGEQHRPTRLTKRAR